MGIPHYRLFGVIAHQNNSDRGVFACRKPQKGGYMASENKKRKAKNSYLISGADKIDGRMKRIMYFTKRQRAKNNRIEDE